MNDIYEKYQKHDGYIYFTYSKYENLTLTHYFDDEKEYVFLSYL